MNPPPPLGFCGAVYLLGGGDWVGVRYEREPLKDRPPERERASASSEITARPIREKMKKERKTATNLLL